MPAIRHAAGGDAETVGRLLHDFNTEFDAPTPGPDALAERIRALLAAGDTAVLLAHDGAGDAGDTAGAAAPDGLAVLRFRPALWSSGLECYLAELYVVPARRGRGLGRALMEAAIALARERGADTIDLGTSEDDVAARSLYESLGFRNREGSDDGPVTYFYEREL